MKKTHLKLSIISLCFMLLLVSCEEKHEHQWESSIKVTPSCETEGILLKTCPCGAIKEEVIPALGHTAPILKTLTPATCKEKGKVAEVCSRCGFIFSEKDIEPSGHGETVTSVIKEPTCLEEGILNVICLSCHQVVEIKKIPALGHNWLPATEKVAPTCHSVGKGVQVCSRDSSHTKEIEIPMVAHDYSGKTWTAKEPTCKDKGILMTKCKYCDAVISSEIDFVDHDWGEYVWKIDENGEPMVSTDFKSGWKIRTCNVCKTTEEIEIAPSHVHHVVFWDEKNTLKNNKPSTCSTHGTIYGYCSCYTDEQGNIYNEPGEGRSRMKVDTKEAFLDPDNHEDIVLEKIEPEGFFSGAKYKKSCKACNAFIGYESSETRKKPMIGHWHFETKGTINEMAQNLVLDLHKYENNMQEFTLTANDMDSIGSMPPGIIPESTFLLRSINGTWITQGKTNRDRNGVKTLYIIPDFVAVTVDKETIEGEISVQLMEGTEYVSSPCMPNEKKSSILGIKADALTPSSFKPEEHTVFVNANTPTTLHWVSLTNDADPTEWTWTENGSETVQSTASYTIKDTTAGEKLITCKAGNETLSVKLIYK